LYYSDPVVSPDGKTIALAASVQRNTSSTSLAGAIAAMAAAAPPGGTQIYLYSLPEDPLQKVSSGSRDLKPQWVPGRNEISFIRRNAIGDTSSALIIRGTGPDDSERVAFELPFMTVVTWFPDGRRVVALDSRACVLAGDPPHLRDSVTH
jgi:Tol biopolymer transport system component